ncbi:acyl-CoA thioesterase/BAAT N-terminal domain-containing protein [Antribacter gilvus]|uniref:acyl-CoA thioesterase/BAAT N-terminal domain-containing protein n=1 Tax=Antribacter gilvus TaxID=2304675 RepID=UPI000F7AB609|nr:acyl-CoA thioesterase/BAAT N-terminal domain-containing protein [Antribacter gilvus]
MPARRPSLALVLAVALCAGLGGCGAVEPRIDVTEVDGPFEPLAIEVSGLPAGEEVRVEATADQWEYTSWATFTVPGDGVLDLAEAEPLDGTWSEPDAMAPFWSMRPAGDGDVPDDAFVAAHTVDLRVLSDGDELAAVAVERPPYHADDLVVTRVVHEGLTAVYAVPGDLAAGERRPAVLAFGGSEGGLSGGADAARTIAALGYPALAIAYFDAPGLPGELTEAPVETFLTALDWLHGQPEVDTGRVFTYGVSRGGEMALWLAANRPGLVHGAFAPVGAGRLVCSPDDYTRSAWSLDGEPLPFTCGWAITRAQDAVTPPPPGSVVALEHIEGPVVLACGARDTVWSSCGYLDAIVRHVEDSGADVDLRVVRDERADHGVSARPYLPGWYDESVADSTRAATHRVRVAFWSAVQEALDEAAAR